MTKIDFAIGASHRVQSAAEFAYKHAQQGGTLCVYSQDKKRLNFFSQLLWNIQEDAFVPHLPFDISLPENVIKNTSIWLTGGDLNHIYPHLKSDVCLLNLDIHVPSHYELFERVIEIVSEVEQDKALARTRWQEYKKNANHQLNSISVQQLLG